MGLRFTRANDDRVHHAQAGIHGLNFPWGLIAVHCYVHTASVDGCLVSFNDGVGTTCSFYLFNTGPLSWWTGVADRVGTTVITPGPQILMAQKATGTVAPRFHIFKNGTWVHENASSNGTDPATTTALTLGSESDTTGLTADVTMFAVGIWPQWAPSDANVERLLPFGNWAKLAPGFLREWPNSRGPANWDANLGRFKPRVTARTGMSQGSHPPVPGFRFSPSRPMSIGGN